MIAAGIDVGTNTVRLLIADVEGGRIRQVLYSGRGITRLGAKIGETGCLSEASMAKTLALLASFKENIDKYCVDKVFAAATSAVREASNSAEFLTAAAKAGIPLGTISGDEEACYTYLGISSTVDDMPDRAVIYDIGGGSTEFIYAVNGGVQCQISTPVGVVKLAEAYGFDGATDSAVHDACMSDIRGRLAEMADMMRAAGAGGGLIGTAGTVTTIAAVDLGMRVYDPAAVNKHILTAGRMREMTGEIAPLTAAGRLALPGMEQGREDLMLPGLLIVRVIMELFGVEASRVSDYGLREGLTIKASEL